MLITAATDVDAEINIFVITSQSENFDSFTWPSRELNSVSCYYENLDTCAFNLSDLNGLNNEEIIVYFTVEVTQDCTYTISPTLHPLLSIQVSSSYVLRFENLEAIPVELSKDNF